MIALIDSWAWVEFFAGSKTGETVKTYVMDKDQEIIISSINLAEIYSIALTDSTSRPQKRGEGP